jgi:hypothetical protein
MHRVCSVMVSMLTLRAVDLWFELWSSQIKDYEIGIGCLSATHTAINNMSKDWLALYQKNVL